jgi:hypothetical protein
MMCTRGVSQDLFPVLTRFGRNCQIPHSWRHISVRFSVLQSVGIIPVPPVIGSKHGTVPPPAIGRLPTAPFRPSVGPEEAPMPMKLGCPTVAVFSGSAPCPGARRVGNVRRLGFGRMHMSRAPGISARNKERDRWVERMDGAKPRCPFEVSLKG